MNSDFDRQLERTSELILGRPLNDEERTEFLNLAAAIGFNYVVDFLYILLIFKRHEDRIAEKVFEMGALADRIDEHLGQSVEKIMHDGAEKISADMTDAIGDSARSAFGKTTELLTLRAYLILTLIVGIVGALGYWLGATEALHIDGKSGPLEFVLAMPAGWWMFLSGVIFTALWLADHQEDVKNSWAWRAILAGMVLLLISLILFLF